MLIYARVELIIDPLLSNKKPWFQPEKSTLDPVVPVAYAEISEGEGFGAEKMIAISGPGNGQKLQKLGLHSKTKCYAFKNILQ